MKLEVDNLCMKLEVDNLCRLGYIKIVFASDQKPDRPGPTLNFDRLGTPETETGRYLVH